MRTIIILLWLMSFAPWVLSAPKYQHKSEAEIARMTPAQRVDEWVNEQVHHQYDLDDDHYNIIKKYILRDGLAALPRMIEIMDEYDPTHRGQKRKGEQFDASFLMLSYMDRQAVRLRGSEEGRRAIKSLERGIQRMRAAGFARKDGHAWEWVPDGRFEQAEAYLQEAKGIGLADEAIRDTFWVQHKIQMSDEELLALSNFLVARDPTYPSWSEKDFIKDYTRINEAGYPFQRHIMRKPERFYEAYLEFKETKR